MAAKLGIAVVAPDTSPRGAKCPGEDETYDFGTGAGKDGRDGNTFGNFTFFFCQVFT